jgi:3'(2'), 5'-bisphosphate nucleotidase
MHSNSYAQILERIHAGLEASRAVFARFTPGAIETEYKVGHDPVTEADRALDVVLRQELLREGEGWLSEESVDDPVRLQRSRVWVVDPLDGTREFVKRNGEFTVNVALVVQHEPLLGVVAAPALGLTYWGATGVGAFSVGLGGELRRIHTAPPQRPLRVVGSRSHASGETAAYLESLGPHVITPMGSSLKFCLLAQGEAELYPRFGATSEWDTAAGQAVLEAAGGHVTRMDGHRLRYNCRESVINGDFVAFSHPSVLPGAGGATPLP